MIIPKELLERTRVKGYTTLIAICDDSSQPGEVRLQAALSLLAATEREAWTDEADPIDAHDALVGSEQV